MIACDLGSNTLRIVELDCKSGHRIKEFERMVKTADGLHESGMINEQATKRIITAIHEAKAMFDLSSAYAVTTAAVRMASNGTEVLAKIKEETGVDFIMIDSNEEAMLTSLAVEWRLGHLGLHHDNYMLMDLGGGSTEIIFNIEGKKRTASFEVGIVTMAQKYGSAKEVEKNLESELLEIKKYIKNSYKTLQKPLTFVATAGTPTTIAAFKEGLDYAHYDVEKVNGKSVSVWDLDKALNRLMAMDVKERERWVGVGRDELIVAGVLIVKSLMKGAGFDEMLVIDDGLREGLALQKCQE